MKGLCPECSHLHLADQPCPAEELRMKTVFVEIERITWREGNTYADACKALVDIRRLAKEESADAPRNPTDQSYLRYSF